VIDIIDIIELPLNNQRLLDLGQIQHIWTHINLVCDKGFEGGGVDNDRVSIGS
jgi:hypothetical protein